MIMKSHHRIPLAAIVVATLVCTTSRAEAQLKKLSTYLPAETNSLIAIDVEALEATEMAIAEKWKEQRQAVREQAGRTGPHWKQVLMGALVQPMHLESTWEITLIETDTAPNMENLADELESNVDNIEGIPAVETGGESYVVRIGEKQGAILNPANRQKVARWLRAKKSYALSEYLQDALNRVTDRTPIVMALELRDVTTPANVRVHIADHEAFEKHQGQVEEISEIIASVQGLSLDVQISKNAAAILRMDFDKPAGPLKDYKDLMIDLLADMGIHTDEFREWNASASGKTWMLQGKLTRQTIDRMFAMVDTRFQAKMHGKGEYPGGKEPEDEASKQARMALNYYRDIEDIVAKVGDYRGAVATMYARWFRERADDLEALPTLGVDPELVDFALNVAITLRQTAGTLRGTSSRKVLQQTSVNLSRGGSYGAFYGGSRWSGGWGGWGGSSYGYSRGGGLYNANAEAAGRARRGTQKRMISVEQRSKAATATFNTLDAIAEEMAKLRLKMTDKYMVQF
ncbi:hypothetical protein CA54_32230 [Symmachiella macrocystis]|uniref:Uncharacterized protein n=1 Tax=Symmachiella macrocystis TaxID=2527985 RepID=A0A5C6BQP9_9PLAN|nr:hypothetical protein [Symmachiella macrocystis]TWU14378.1 hypothetical protein CA54_32230 [Symmachiella macrocystis]